MRIIWRLTLQAMLISMVSVMIYAWSSLSAQSGRLLTNLDLWGMVYDGTLLSGNHRRPPPPGG